MDENRKVYENKKNAGSYFKQPWLFSVEKNFLKNHGKLLTGFNMLDVGIGGGRTTPFFANRVREYIGIDYSSLMINYCSNKFKKLENAVFKNMDARNLNPFVDNYFDLVLFSFNGIDCVDYEGRIEILNEFYRVLKPKGLLLFSFHNARHLHKLYSLQCPRNPFRIFKELKRIKKIKKINGAYSLFENEEYFSIYDGADHFKTKILYLTVERQDGDLKSIGFRSTGFKDMQTGKVILREQWKQVTMPWIFVEAEKI
ncbi:MAG: class I SAM-dependent methyltransferase [Chitinophagales bacterium]|nr:class I SAM-dependent methyltransferase [Chitinophagales bacterium]